MRADIHLMAVKLRDAEGRASNLVPAYGDADPGYHTALSLMDALDLLDELTEPYGAENQADGGPERRRRLAGEE